MGDVGARERRHARAGEDEATAGPTTEERSGGPDALSVPRIADGSDSARTEADTRDDHGSFIAFEPADGVRIAGPTRSARRCTGRRVTKYRNTCDVVHTR